MRLIDADKLKADFIGKRYGVQAIEYVIDQQPTVYAVGVVSKNETTTEVVRCKDCKYYLNSNEKCVLVDTRLRFYETDKVWTEDSYCSWGERKEDVFN